jgi:hypothetical protein
MALADSIRALRDRTLADLNATHDYYDTPRSTPPARAGRQYEPEAPARVTTTAARRAEDSLAGASGSYGWLLRQRGSDERRPVLVVVLSEECHYYADTMFAWQFVDSNIAAGIKFTNRNVVTGSVTTQTDLAAKAVRYVDEQLPEATFQQFIVIFELFFFDFLRLWLLAYPRSLMGKKVDFKVVLDAPDKDAITLEVVNKELNEVLYERPTGWFTYLNEKVKLGCPTGDEISRIAEAKASRDVLVHNRGIAGKTYVSKAANLARYQGGERIEISEPYHRETWELIRKVVTDITDAAIAMVP